MKKNITTIGIIIIVSLLLTACSHFSKTEPVSMEGKWVITELEIEGEDAMSALEEEGYRKEDLENLFYFEFFKDGKFIVKYDDKQDNGIYQRDGNKLIIKTNGDKIETILNGNSFSIADEKNEMKMTFTKK